MKDFIKALLISFGLIVIIPLLFIKPYQYEAVFDYLLTTAPIMWVLENVFLLLMIILAAIFIYMFIVVWGMK